MNKILCQNSSMRLGLSIPKHFNTKKKEEEEEEKKRV